MYMIISVGYFWLWWCKVLIECNFVFKNINVKGDVDL